MYCLPSYHTLPRAYGLVGHSYTSGLRAFWPTYLRRVHLQLSLVEACFIPSKHLSLAKIVLPSLTVHMCIAYSHTKVRACTWAELVCLDLNLAFIYPS